MAKDIYHKIVKEALIKATWDVTHDPYLIPRKHRKPYEVDLGAEKIIAAEKGTEYIAVEVKSFSGSSMTYDFHTACGQYGTYKLFISEIDSLRNLYLAVSEEVYQSFFTDPDVIAICDYFKISLLVFDSEKIEITQWIKR
jgi:XisH protein